MSDHDEQTNSNSTSSSNSRSADAPSFLKRHVIDEHTGISFGDANKSSSVPEATRRVGGGISFATLPSASVMPSFTPSLGMGPTMTTLSSKTASVMTTQAAPPPSEGSWMLRSVPTLPEFHPLERTATFVPNAASDPSQISSRISHVLRDRSIEAHYDNDKAKVRCTSMDGVDFRVRLYRGRGPSYSHGIIVEVQRRFGTSYTFHHDTQAILDAAHGKNVASTTPLTAASSGSAALPMVSDAEVTDSEAEFANSPPPPSTSSMDMVATMFSYPGYDSQYLAYQTLIPLTSAARMGRSTAKTVATQLLQPGNAVGAKVLDAVLAVPASQARLTSSSSGPSRRGSLEDDSDDEDEDTSSGSDEEFTTKLQTMAWTVLSNAVHATKGQAVNSTVREELRPALLRVLQEASANPRHAQMAALCAEHLMELGHDNDDLVDALERAVDVGRVKHAGLKAQAQRCLDKVRRM